MAMFAFQQHAQAMQHVRAVSDKIYAALPYLSQKSLDRDLRKAAAKSLYSSAYLLEVINLIAQGADVNTCFLQSDCTFKGIRLLHLAVTMGNLPLLAILVSAKANVNIENGVVTPLHNAVSAGNLQIVNLLIGLGAHVNAQTSDAFLYRGVTPLMLAAKCCSVSIVKKLLQAGADISIQDNTGLTVDWYAQSEGGMRWR